MDVSIMNAVAQTPAMQTDGIQGALGGDAGLEGLFAMLFGQMLGQADVEGMAEDPMLGTLFSSMAEGETTDDTQLLAAMQLLAQSMSAPQAMEFLLGQTADNALVQSVAQAQTQDPMMSHLQGLLEQLQQAVPQQPQAERRDTEWDEMLRTLSTAWQESEDGESLAPERPMEQLQFASAVRQVREQLAERPRAVKEETRQPLDIEALQEAVDSRQYVPENITARQEAPELRDIADQLKTGILENLRQGKNEFVVKLKPEGLGEITVKLTESKNEVALRIVTSSAAVGKMIANEVNALQNALRPLRAQVQEIVTVPATQESAAQAMLTGGQGEQQFAWHYRQQEQQHSGTRRDADGGEDFESLVDEIAPDDASVNVLI